MRTLAALLVLFSFFAPRDVFASAAGYVYVLDPATGCPTCAGPQVLVFDGGTAQLVTRIPLNKNTTPAGIAVSGDGAHAYVSNFAGGASSITVIDARHHRFVATYLVGNIAGLIAASADDSAVFIRVDTKVYRFDTATHSVTTSITVDRGLAIAFDDRTNTVVVGVYGTGAAGVVTTHDPVSLAEIQRVSIATGVIALRPSRTGERIDVLRERVSAGEPTALTRLDASTLTVLDDRLLTPASGLGGPVEALRRASIYVGGLSVLEIPEGSGGPTTIPLPVTTLATAIAIPPGQQYAFITAAQRDATGLTAVAAIDLDTRQIVSTYPLDGPPGVDLIASTPDGVVSCTYHLDSADASFAIAPTATVPVRMSTDCAWQATADVPWISIASESGSGNGTGTLSGAGNDTISIQADVNNTGQTRTGRVNIGGQIVTVTQAGDNAVRAFGQIDTPSDGESGITGSLAVTGWALDDVGVTAVRVYREPVAGESATLVFLGTATFVEGARPDVQAVFPALPFASRAGWGYMLLTNVLPNGGNGTYRLRVVAEDVDGHTTPLGTRTIECVNGTATLPFGAIDTPAPGETVSGTILNWGWALTPQPANIPTDGSTIDVVIDGVVVGHPVYGLDRSDIAALFPGYMNTHSAVGHFTIDTTTMINGVHTIAWVVRDNLGRAQGIGSRYFTVFNP